MGYKVVQVLLLLLLFGVRALGQAGIPSEDSPSPPLVPPSPPSIFPLSPPPSPPVPLSPPPLSQVSPLPAPPPGGSAPQLSNGGVSPPPPITSPAPQPASGDTPTASPSPNPSLLSNQTGFNTWTVDTNDKTRTILASANNKFTFNLMITNQTFCVALVQHVPSNVTVWVANFDSLQSPNVTSCSFTFSSNDLVLTTNDGVIWNANPGNLMTSLELDDTGRLLLKRTVEQAWTSFDHPSDIIITGQNLNSSKQIWAALADNEYLQGNGYMQVESTEVIIMNNNSHSTAIFTLLGETTDTSISYVVMNNGLRVVPGNFMVNSTSNFAYERKSLWEYARVTSAGNLVIASYVDVLQQGGEYYGICSGNGECHCPEGFLPVEGSSPGFACKRNATQVLTACTRGNSADSFSNVSGMSYSGFMTSNATSNVSAENCKSLCMKDCNCTMALHVGPDATHSTYDLGTCYTNLGDLMQTVTQTGDNNTGLQILFLRIYNGAGASAGSSKSSRKTAASAFAIGAGALVFLLLLVSAWFLYDSRRRLFAHADSGKWDSATLELLSSRWPQEFTYQELVDSTGNFHRKLGSGGFSSVYAGHLPDNTKIAVKKLDEYEHKEKEFLAAVTTISSISHPNLVPLLGFCKDRILVYEFVNEGRSLNWYLWNSSRLINAQTSRAIVLETARGLAHLHKDCNVLHGDLKPENIVMDRSMHPWLVDFGLVSLMTPEQRINVATMRNLHGYMAPEWFKSQPITEKADVYSLGVVILELVSGRRCLKQGASPEKCFLPTWGFSLLRRGEDCVLELVDPRLDVRNLPATDQQVLKGMVFVALWCVQENASMRPPMKEVVRMLEGDTSVDTPPPSPALDAFARELYAGKRAPESTNNSFMHSSSLSRTSDMLLR